MKKGLVVAAAGLLALASVGLAVAGLNRNASVHLSGAFEAPVRDTNAQGQAIFHVAKDGESIAYKLIVSNVENVIMAHIHVGAPGTNGPVAVWLYPEGGPPPATAGGGRTDGVLAAGTISADDLVGPLAGADLSDLVALVEGGGAYVNVHTNDGVEPPNTGPGDFPGGEVRGDF